MEFIIGVILGTLLGLVINSFINSFKKKKKINHNKQGFITTIYNRAPMVIHVEEQERLLDRSRIKILSNQCDYPSDITKFKNEYDGKWYPTKNIQLDDQLKEKLDTILETQK